MTNMFAGAAGRHVSTVDALAAPHDARAALRGRARAFSCRGWLPGSARRPAGRLLHRLRLVRLEMGPRGLVLALPRMRHRIAERILERRAARENPAAASSARMGAPDPGNEECVMEVIRQFPTMPFGSQLVDLRTKPSGLPTQCSSCSQTAQWHWSDETGWTCSRCNPPPKRSKGAR